MASRVTSFPAIGSIQELAVVIAALRWWQGRQNHELPHRFQLLFDVAMETGDAPLTHAEIDDLITDKYEACFTSLTGESVCTTSKPPKPISPRRSKRHVRGLRS